MNNLVKKQESKSQPSFLKVNTIDDVKRLTHLLASSNLLPKKWRGRDEAPLYNDIMIALMQGMAFNFTPLESLNNIAVINGVPRFYGDSLVSLVRRHPCCIGLSVTYKGDLKNETLVATCIGRRLHCNGDIETQEVSFSIDDAKRANLWNKERSPWVTYPKIMLGKRARGFVIRDLFADLIHGCITNEEAEDYNKTSANYVEIDTRQEPSAEIREEEPEPEQEPAKTTLQLTTHQSASDAIKERVKEGIDEIEGFIKLCKETGQEQELSDFLESVDTKKKLAYTQKHFPELIDELKERVKELGEFSF